MTAIPADLIAHADLISGDDPRFSVLPGGTTLRDAVEDNLLTAADLEEVVAVARHILAGTLEDGLALLVHRAYAARFHKSPDERWTAAMHARFGLSGPPQTLDAAGALVGVTRERVRQVTAKVRLVLRGRWAPQMGEVLRRMVELSPVLDPVGRQLAQDGLTGPELNAQSLLAFVDLLGVDVEQVTGTQFRISGEWLTDVREGTVTDAVKVASKHTSTFGMTTAEDVRQALSTPEQPASLGDVTRVLRRNQKVRWAGEWLWVEKDEDNPHANAMVNALRAMLSVNSPQRVESLHEGFRRAQKFRSRDIVPTTTAMRVFIENSPLIKVLDDDLVELAEPLDYHDHHGPVAATMIDVLKAIPGQVTDRASLMQTWDAAGVASGTAGVWTTYAEWMDRYGPNVWGLRGATPSAALVTEIQRAAKMRSESEARRTGWGWAPDGSIVLTMDVTTSALGSGTMMFGDQVRQILGTRRFAVIGPDGTDGGLVRVSADHGWTWGWGKPFRAYDVEVGDVVQVVLDLTTEQASLHVGGQELWA